MLRHLVAKVVPVAVLVNAGINAALAVALYRDAHVPLVGKGSIADDTFVAAFLIGLITFLTVASTARRHARAGRLRGFGCRGLGFIERHPVLVALAFAFALVFVLAWPAVYALAATGARSLSRFQFVGFKAAFAGVTGAFAAACATLVAALPVPHVSDDPRWCRAPARTGEPSWPCDYIDKGGLAVTDRARGCSGTPTWQLVVRGALAPAHVRTALADVVTRYPVLRTRVQSLDGVPPYASHYRYATTPRFTLDEMFAVADLRRDPDALSALLLEHHNRHCDLFEDPPVTLTLALTSDDSCRLLFRQHHAIADGRAFIGLLADFARYLEAARAGVRPPSDTLVPIGRRPELEALALAPVRRARYRAAGYLWVVGNVVQALVRPPLPFVQNRSNDYRGDNGTVHWVVADSILERWNAARKRAGVSLNSLLTAALVVANRRWHRAAGQPVGRARGNIIMETRPRDSSFVSFANHLATLDVEADLAREDDVLAIARRFQAQVAAQVARAVPVKRLLAEQQLVAGMSVAEMQRFVFESRRASYTFNFSNLIPLAFASLAGAGWSVEEVLITTPVTPRTGMALTAIRYGGRLFFNFNYKASALSRADTEALRSHFEAVLAEL